MLAKSLLVSDVVPGESPRELLLEDGVSFLAGEDLGLLHDNHVEAQVDLSSRVLFNCLVYNCIK